SPALERRPDSHVEDPGDTPPGEVRPRLSGEPSVRLRVGGGVPGVLGAIACEGEHVRVPGMLAGVVRALLAQEHPWIGRAADVFEAGGPPPRGPATRAT